MEDENFGGVNQRALEAEAPNVNNPRRRVPRRRWYKISHYKTTSNELFEDAILRHQIGLLRVAGTIRNDVIDLLNATEVDIRRRIRELGRTNLQRERLLQYIRTVRTEAWGEARTLMRENIREVARAEVAFADMATKSVVPVILATSIPTASRLREIVSSEPIRGVTLARWGRVLQRSDIERVESTIRQGLVEGVNNQELARRVAGSGPLRGQGWHHPTYKA